MPHPCTPTAWSVGYADAMAHRAILDLSAFIGHKDPARHRIVVAGDFNLIHGATERNPLAFPARDRSVYAGFDALGFEFVGWQYLTGRLADPSPSALAPDTRKVPIYHSTRQTPRTVANQLDCEFVSHGFPSEVRTRAFDDPEEWRPSDDCPIAIRVDASYW